MAPLSFAQGQLFGRVTKPTVDLSSKPRSAPAPRKLYSRAGAKRKREEDDLQESRKSSDAVSCLSPPCKQPKISLAQARRPVASIKTNPVTSQPEGLVTVSKTESAQSKPNLSLVLHNLSKPIRTLITLHKYFLKALSIHYAHNGPHSPAPIDRLLETITRLWKERSVTESDLQKMLAIHEVNADRILEKGEEIARASSPFKLSRAGSCTSIEYVGKRKDIIGPLSTVFDEKEVHDSYRTQLYALESAWEEKCDGLLSFLDDDTLDDFPKLAVEMGTQTASRKAHVSQQRAEILTLSNAAQPHNTKLMATIRNRRAEELSNAITVVESRKQNLLDRIKAKQPSSKAKPRPTSLQILRKHALGRIEEVTDVLRMMQQQQKAEGRSNAREQNWSNFTSSTGAGKVSFGLKHLCNNIKSSARVPVSDEEVTMCLKMLSDELDGTWVKIIESRGISETKFVVVEGEGMTGKEVQSRLMAKQV